jgi:Rrf2 family protein
MRVSAKADYAVRAAAELAAAGDEGPVKGERLADAQDIPLQFLEHILLELKHHGIVRARRGAKGGYWLARPAGDITVADVIRTLDGAAVVERTSRWDGLDTVWESISQATMDAAQAITLDTVAGGSDVRLTT